MECLEASPAALPGGGGMTAAQVRRLQRKHRLGGRGLLLGHGDTATHRDSSTGEKEKMPPSEKRTWWPAGGCGFP